jgi:hypothetical protein
MQLVRTAGLQLAAAGTTAAAATHYLSQQYLLLSSRLELVRPYKVITCAYTQTDAVVDAVLFHSAAAVCMCCITWPACKACMAVASRTFFCRPYHVSSGLLKQRA